MLNNDELEATCVLVKLVWSPGMTALLNYSLCSQSLQSHGEAATSRRKKKNVIKPSLSRCRNKPGVFMRAVSHSVFVVEAVAWVGPWG